MDPKISNPVIQNPIPPSFNIKRQTATYKENTTRQMTMEVIMKMMAAMTTAKLRILSTW